MNESAAFTYEDAQAPSGTVGFSYEEANASPQEGFSYEEAQGPSSVGFSYEEAANESPSFMDQVGGGIDSVQSSFQKTGALIADKVGADDVAGGLRDDAAANDAEAAKVQYQSEHGETGWKQALNLTDPDWWKATIAEALPGSAPFLAGATAGAVATPFPHPVAKLIGAGLGGGAAVVLQEVGPAYEEFLKANPDDAEGATDYAIKKAGLTGVINAASIGLGPLGYGAGPIKHALIQMAIQPTVGVADTVASNAMEKAYVDPNQDLSEGVAKSAVGEIAVDAPGTVGIVRNIMKPNISEDLQAGEVRSDNAGDAVEPSGDPSVAMGEEAANTDAESTTDGIRYEDAVNMADSVNVPGMSAAEADQIAPKVPEPASTIEAQLDAFREGRKPSVLITPGEQMPQIPEGAKTFEIEGSGTLIYQNQQVLAKALNPETLGEALGYGTGAKPENPTGSVISMDAQGRVVAEQITDETNPDIHQSIMAAAENIAGEGGSVDLQPIEQVLEQRQAAVAADMGGTASIQVPTVEKGSGGASDVSLPQDPKEIERAAQRQAFAAINQGENFEYKADEVSAGTEVPSGAIESFGEKLKGSKRDKYQRMRDAVSDDEVANVPLSKSWPKADLDKIEDTYQAAFIKSIREEIPAKPRQSHKLKRWSEKVAMMRKFADDIQSGEVDVDTMKKMVGDNRVLREFETKVDLLSKLDRSLWDSVKTVSDWPNAYRYNEEGNKQSNPSISVNKKRYNYNESWTEVVDEIKADLGATARQPASRMKFEVRGNAADGYFINKTGDSEYRKLTDRFTDSKEAFSHIQNNHEDLVKAWDGVKARDNVGKGDVRNKTNRERTGVDHRKGKDIAEAQFTKAFGFRGVDFGNYVKQGNGKNERQQSLNDAYDALMDLSEIMNVPTQALSLNGELGLAFGARGSGGASAHFEGADTEIKDSDFLINLTKTRGAGTLAHEFFHALDNYFQRQRGTAKGREGHYVTYEPTAMMVHNSGRTKLTKKALAEAQKKYPNSGFYKAENWDVDPAHTNEIRPEVEQAFEELVDALDASPMRSRARTIDKNKADGYWSRIIERAARSFENYVINEMALKGYENDYLANVKDWDSWSKNSERYPYLKPDEIAPIKEAFDNLFVTLETKKTEKGVALFSRSKKADSGVPITTEKLGTVIDQVVARVGNSWPVHTLHSFGDLPVSIQEQADAEGHDGNDVDGVFHRGDVYLIRENLARHSDPELKVEEALLHEFAHGDIRAMYGKQMAVKLNNLFLAAGGYKGIKDIADRHGIDLKPYAKSGALAGMTTTERQNLIMDEMLAHLAQEKPSISKRVKEIIGMIRQWLRDHGFAKLANYGEADLLNVLRQARNATISVIGDRATFMVSNHNKDDFKILPQRSGTLIVKGDPKEIRAALEAAGRKAKGIPRKDGLLFGKSQAEGVRKALEASNNPKEKHESTPAGMGGFDGFVDDHNKAVKALSWDSVIGFAKDKRRILMGALTNLQLGEVYSPTFKGMLNGNPLINYNTHLQNLEAERNGALHEAELIDQAWDKLDNKEANEVGTLMNDATMYAIHPDQAFESQMPELKEKLQQVRNEAEAEVVQKEIQNENHRKLAYSGIKKRYEALSEDAKGVYSSVRDLYVDQWKKTQEAMIARIARNIPDEGLRKQSITEIRLAFRKAIKIGPYFPLARFGDYVTIARKGDDYIRDHHATSAQQKRAAVKYRKAGFQVSRLKSESFGAGDLGNAPAFAQDVFELLDKYGLKQSDLADDVNQLMLRMMPDMSALKHNIHRKRIKGYSGDARRAFGHTAFHGAHHLSRIMYADRMQNEITRMKDEIALLQSGKVSVLDDGNLAVDLLNEMKVRHEKIMNPNSHPMTSHLGSLGFIWYLGASPAAGIVNMTQTPLVTLPMLAGKYGWGKSSAALMRAMKDYARSPFKAGSYEAWVSLDRNKLISKSEKALIDELIKDGTLDITQAHALAQLSETDTRHNAKGEMSRGRAKAMRYVGAFFHNAEVLNRQVSALAAYRLAKESGSNHQQAVDQAHKIVFDSHFNYASSNRPRYLKGDVVRVLTMFKQYSQHMTYALLRNFNQSFKGESKEVRNQARMTLAGILSQHALAAGTLGLPLVSVIFSALDLAFDDEDEPYDSKAAYRNWLADTFGTKVGEAIAKGPVNAYTGIELHSRVSLGELWLRTPDRDLKGKKEALYYMEQAAGPIGALFLNVWSGAGSIAEGHVQRGFEKMVPKFVRDFARAARYHEEGITTYKGDPIIEDTTPAEEVSQALGFSPSRAGERYEARSAVKNMKSGIDNRRQQLLNWFAESIRDSDSEKQSEVIEKIARFNKKNPSRLINAKGLKRSLKTRARISGQTEHGIYLPKNSKHLMEEGRFAQ